MRGLVLVLALAALSAVAGAQAPSDPSCTYVQASPPVFTFVSGAETSKVPSMGGYASPVWFSCPNGEWAYTVYCPANVNDPDHQVRPKRVFAVLDPSYSLGVRFNCEYPHLRYPQGRLIDASWDTPTFTEKVTLSGAPRQPGFEAVFAIAGLIAVSFLVGRRNP